MDVDTLVVDLYLGSFHALFLLNVGLILENLERHSSLVKLESFYFEDEVDELLPVHLLRVILFEHRDVAHEVHESGFIARNLAKELYVVSCDLLQTLVVSLISGHLHEVVLLDQVGQQVARIGSGGQSFVD